ncbi:hypothetical protein AOLI_G00055360 [Acnodon oligacanthus]
MNRLSNCHGRLSQREQTGLISSATLAVYRNAGAFRREQSDSSTGPAHFPKTPTETWRGHDEAGFPSSSAPLQLLPLPPAALRLKRQFREKQQQWSKQIQKEKTKEKQLNNKPTVSRQKRDD